MNDAVSALDDASVAPDLSTAAAEGITPMETEDNSAAAAAPAEWSRQGLATSIETVLLSPKYEQIVYFLWLYKKLHCSAQCDEYGRFASGFCCECHWATLRLTIQVTLYLHMRVITAKRLIWRNEDNPRVFVQRVWWQRRRERFRYEKKKSSNEQKVSDLFPHNWLKIPHITRQIKEIAGGAQMPWCLTCCKMFKKDTGNVNTHCFVASTEHCTFFWWGGVVILVIHHRCK